MSPVFKLDSFLRNLLSHLAGTLEEIIGVRDSSGFIAVVGQQVGEEVNQGYCQALKTDKLSRQQVAQSLIDFKHSIEGDFFIVEENEDRIVLGNHRCPFAHFVEGHPSLCMMTSTVFGVVASQNLGYAKVVLNETIAQGNAGCLVTIHLHQTEESELAEGREFYQV